MTEATIVAPAPGAALFLRLPLLRLRLPRSLALVRRWRFRPDLPVDPGKFPIREDYAAALLKEKLGALPGSEEQPVPADEPVALARASFAGA